MLFKVRSLFGVLGYLEGEEIEGGNYKTVQFTGLRRLELIHYPNTPNKERTLNNMSAALKLGK